MSTRTWGCRPSSTPTQADRRAVLLAAPRGYCAGVDRAVITVEKALELYGAPVYVRKQIVHNKHVVADLEARGAIFVEETRRGARGRDRRLLRARRLAGGARGGRGARRCKTIDATCPLVTKVHHEAMRFADDDYDILLIGHEGHEEVEGTAGEAPEHIQLVDGPDDVADVEVRDPAKVAWLSQTTLSVDETLETVAALRERFPQLLDPPSDDICYATQNRQLAVKEIAAERRPGDRGRLGATPRTRCAWSRSPSRPAPRRPTASTTPPRSTRPGSTASTTVGVTSGASVPEDLVDGVLDFLAERGYPDAEAVHTRRGVADLRAAAGAAPRPARGRSAPDGLTRHGPLPRRPPRQPAAAAARAGRRRRCATTR